MFGPTGDHKGWQKFCVLCADLGVVVAAGGDFDSLALLILRAEGGRPHSYKAATHL